MKKFFAFLTVASLLASSASAAVMVSGNMVGEDIPGLDGYKAYTLKATSDAGAIVGFDFAGAGASSGLGITGDMRTVKIFGSLSTIWTDNNALFANDPTAGPVMGDSQFLVASTAGLTLNPLEEPGLLQGAITNLADSQELDFVRVVLPSDATGMFNGTITVRNGSGGFADAAVSGPIGVPEPATLSLAGLAIAGVVGLRRRRA